MQQAIPIKVIQCLVIKPFSIKSFQAQNAFFRKPSNSKSYISHKGIIWNKNSEDKCEYIPGINRSNCKLRLLDHKPPFWRCRIINRARHLHILWRINSEGILCNRLSVQRTLWWSGWPVNEQPTGGRGREGFKCGSL